MTRAAEGAFVRAASADLFGLWEPAPVAGGLRFSIPNGELPAPAQQEAAAVWRLALHSGTDPQPALDGRAAQVQAVEVGLAAAGPRLDALLSARAVGGGLAFASPEQPLAAPEQSLAQALDALEGIPASYGLGDLLPGLARLDGPALRAALGALAAGVDQAVLRFAWVETTLDGRLAVRTTVAWSGTLSTCCHPGLAPLHLQAHGQSLALALQSRAAQVRAALAAAQMAGKIALAVTTPLGPAQALALAGQFLLSIVRSARNG
jgi:hypothetical protein